MPRRPRVLSEADRATWAGYARMIAPLAGRTAATTSAPTGGQGDVSGGDSNESALPARRLGIKLAGEAKPAGGEKAGGGTARAAIGALAVGAQPGGVDSATWQRFRSGKLNTVRKLDLHGLTVQHAFHALLGFLRNAHAERLRCVEIVTGRGNGEVGGAIKRELPHWLNRPEIRPMVLGAVHPHALNSGSVRLLLRRVR